MKKLLISLLLVSPCYAGLITHNDYTSGNTITASGQNTNENTIVNEFNGNIDNTNIKAGGIATSNIANGAVSLTKLSSVIQSSITVMAVTDPVGYTQTFTDKNIFSSATFMAGPLIVQQGLSLGNGVTYGSPNNVLVSVGQGSTGAPQWKSNTSIGGVQLLAIQSTSSSSTVTFSGLTDNYAEYKVVIAQLHPSNDATDLYVTATCGAGGTSYSYSNLPGTTGSGNAVFHGAAGVAQFNLTDNGGNQLGSGAGRVLSGEITFIGPQGPTNNKNVLWQIGWVSNGGSFMTTSGSGLVACTGNITAINIAASAGTISGAYILFGAQATIN